MNISSDLMSSTISSPPSAPPPRPEGETGSPVSHVQAVEKLGTSLSDDDRNALMTAAQDLEDSGASFDDVKSFVDSELASYGVEPLPGGQRSGQMLDMFA